MSRAAPSGKQFELRLGAQAAIITEVGAGLRTYTVDGHDVLDGYAVDQMCPSARGASLLPWPNRIADGRYEFGGREHQLPLTEPEARNAIHGLTRWANWHAVHDTGHSLRLQHVLPPQDGYPFHLRCEIGYRLTAGGLEVETRATNLGATPAPYATGAHPYLRLDTELVDELSLAVPAATYHPTDERGIPTGTSSVDGTPFDLRDGPRLGDRVIDHAFTDLTRDGDGRARVVLSSPSGRRTELWLDEHYGYLELFTGDTLPEAGRRRRGLGVEPMTAAPNAFRTGDGLVSLGPDETHTATWGLHHSA